MYYAFMDRQRMHRLGKRLVELSRQAELQPHDVMPSPAESLVLSDVILFPDSTVGEVVGRTGFTQGYVSKCVAGLVEQGLLATSTDEADRRRTLIRPTVMLERAVKRRTKPVVGVLEGVVSDPAKAKRALSMLDELADLLLP
jgi:DNA-binding MarR family transcriptional regulator